MLCARVSAGKTIGTGKLTIRSIGLWKFRCSGLGGGLVGGLSSLANKGSTCFCARLWLFRGERFRYINEVVLALFRGHRIANSIQSCPSSIFPYI